MLLIDLTPKPLRCTYGPCPTVYKDDNGWLVIIGSKVTPEIYNKVRHKVAPHEDVITIRPEFFAHVPRVSPIVL